MRVCKRDGQLENISFDKVLQRIRKAARGLSVSSDALAQQVLSRITDGIKTEVLDDLTAQMAASLGTSHPDWNRLAANIAVSNHHKKTDPSFSKTMLALADQTNPKTGEPICAIHQSIIDLCKRRGEELDALIVHTRDYDFDYFGFKTLERSYLLKDASMVVRERPQHLWLRVSLALWPEDWERAKDTYEALSTKQFTHATPTLFNAGLPRQQLSSCFLLSMHDDSISGIYKTLGDCAAISKYSGGIGLHCHTIRAKGSLIKGTGGVSNGLVPMLRVFNNTARYVDQGGGKRNGSFAIYLEPWHADVEDFLKMKLPTGTEEDRGRDLFYALWIPDLFMKRVEEDGDWSLFCPAEAPGLADVWGTAFDELYTRYEREGRARKCVSAQKLWFQILDTQMETGTPYLLYKDAANAKSNQQNLGTIKSSNLCTEILEYSSPDETAVCNLASLSLPAFVSEGVFDFAKAPASQGAEAGSKNLFFDFEKLRKATRRAIENLNKVIDINFYPTPETERSNMRHRPVGLGVQGLADVFASLKFSWEGPEAADLNQRIFEHIYYEAVSTSADLAVSEGAYSSFQGCPANQGRLQPDLWNVTPLTQLDGSLDWNVLRAKAATGLRNSLLLAPMPTASTSQILGNNECFEPFTSNIYTRRTLAGEFIMVNKYLMQELLVKGLWTEEMKQQIIARNGSVQGLDEIPQEMQERYKTGWELKQKVLIDMAAARGAFIDQSQSLNLFVAEANYAKLTSMHFYAWKAGLKTGCYYLRTKAPVMAQKFTVDPRLLAAVTGSGGTVKEEDREDDRLSVSTEESDDEEVETPAEKKRRERQELLDRLAAEFEQESKAAKAAADAGEGCLMCSG